MKKGIVLLAALMMALSVFSVTVQATPDRAARTGKACGECHSHGRHMGN